MKILYKAVCLTAFGLYASAFFKFFNIITWFYIKLGKSMTTPFLIALSLKCFKIVKRFLYMEKNLLNFIKKG